MNKIMNKKISVNAILNIIKSIMSLIFPLITFPYISRVLGVENIGKINFANSFVSYFILIAGLGISAYGIRECAKRRNDKKELDLFASQLFSFNIFSALVSYIILFIALACIPTMRQYNTLIIIYSMQILFNTIGTDWINVALEEFKYITVRYIVCQVISIIMMFIFIHSDGEYIIYAIVSVVALSGANIANFFHVKKFCNIKFTLQIPWKKFSKPIFQIFIATLATTIYTNLDITMLGYIKNDYIVGIYSCALKIYRILKQIIIAIIFVYEPRLSFQINKNENEYIKISNKLFNIILTLVIPLVIGTCLISENAIVLFAGEEFRSSASILRILSFSVIFSSIAYYIIHIIMLPKGQEYLIGIPTVMGAIVDIFANSILIPKYGANGAAIATLIAEFSVFMTSCLIGNVSKVIKFNFKILIKIIIGCLGIIMVNYIFKFIDNYLLNLFLVVICSIIIYFLLEILLKNDVIISYYNYFMSKFKILVSLKFKRLISKKE
jgi:O-antigen/teichoic acid export membrane protein